MTNLRKRLAQLGCTGGALLLATLAGCASFSVEETQIIETANARAFTWSWASSGECVLLELDLASHAVLQELDRGDYVEHMGPYATPDGVVWARRTAGEEWRVVELGVAGRDMRRSASRDSALAAAWHIERVIGGHFPGNAAELATLRPFARTGAWPK
ncbi:MAG: hypothetical protein ACYS26_08000 [Planctomycetota bacterium]|jgi:hypothetical protein